MTDIDNMKVNVHALFNVFSAILAGICMSMMLQAVKNIREDAVRHGKAEWYVDRDGKTKWRWKEVQP